MKVFQLIQKPQLRGAEIFACQLGNNILSLNHDCKVVSIFKGNAKLPFIGEHIQLGRPLQKRFIDFSGWKQLARLVEKERPDVIQANAGDTLKFVVLSKLIFGWKVPIVYRNANMMGNFIDSKLKYWLNKFFVNNVDYVISVSALCLKDFIKTFSYSVNKIQAIPIGIEPKQIGSLPDDIKSFFSEGPVLVNVASLVPEKNHKGLLQAFSSVSQIIPDVKLVIIGEGRLKAQLISLTADLGLENKVKFLGARNDVLEIIKACQVFALPSSIEGLPAVILEAMYCKTPVVANDVGGISEVINDKTGWLTNRIDIENFIKNILDVLTGDEVKVRNITEFAYRNVLDNYDNQVISRRFLMVYEQLAQKRLGIL